MKISTVDWDVIHARLIRTGWAAGWGAGMSAGGMSLVSGASPDLAALRAGVGFASFVLVGIVTGTLLARLAPSMIAPAEPKKGALVDEVVGDEPQAPEAELDVAKPEEDELDAA